MLQEMLFLTTNQSVFFCLFLCSGITPALQSLGNCFLSSSSLLKCCVMASEILQYLGKKYSFATSELQEFVVPFTDSWFHRVKY